MELLFINESMTEYDPKDCTAHRCISGVALDCWGGSGTEPKAKLSVYLLIIPLSTHANSLSRYSTWQEACSKHLAMVLSVQFCGFSMSHLFLSPSQSKSDSMVLRWGLCADCTICCRTTIPSGQWRETLVCMFGVIVMLQHKCGTDQMPETSAQCCMFQASPLYVDSG